MTQYKYKAKDETGKIIQSSIQANSKEEAIEKIQKCSWISNPGIPSCNRDCYGCDNFFNRC